MKKSKKSKKAKAEEVQDIVEEQQAVEETSADNAEVALEASEASEEKAPVEELAEEASVQEKFDGLDAEEELIGAESGESIHEDSTDWQGQLELSDEVAGELRSEDGSGPPQIKVDIPLPIKTQVESLIFASAKPLKAEDIKAILYEEVSVEHIEELLVDLKAEHDARQGGYRLEFLKGLGYQFQTVAESGPLMERLFSSRPRPLSRPALETLAIIAYRQPATRAAVEFIRGVDSGSIIKNLMDRDLIKCVGRREDAGRPMLFGTTDEFLRVFGISSVKDLPSLQSFQPDSETMQEALKDLEAIDKVDVEQFVADADNEIPEVSSGLLASEEETTQVPTEILESSDDAGTTAESIEQ